MSADPVQEAQSAALQIKAILSDLLKQADATIEELKAANERRDQMYATWREEIKKR